MSPNKEDIVPQTVEEFTSALKCTLPLEHSNQFYDDAQFNKSAEEVFRSILGKFQETSELDLTETCALTPQITQQMQEVISQWKVKNEENRRKSEKFSAQVLGKAKTNILELMRRLKSNLELYGGSNAKDDLVKETVNEIVYFLYGTDGAHFKEYHPNVHSAVLETTRQVRKCLNGKDFDDITAEEYEVTFYEQLLCDFGEDDDSDSDSDSEMDTPTVTISSSDIAKKEKCVMALPIQSEEDDMLQKTNEMDFIATGGMEEKEEEEVGDNNRMDSMISESAGGNPLVVQVESEIDDNEDSEAKSVPKPCSSASATISMRSVHAPSSPSQQQQPHSSKSKSNDDHDLIGRKRTGSWRKAKVNEQIPERKSAKTKSVERGAGLSNDHDNEHGSRFYSGPCNASFLSVRKLHHHNRLKHKETLPFGCSYCDKRFNKLIGLMTHVVNHAHEDFYPFKCPTCGRSISSVPALRRHMEKMHSLERDAAQKLANEAAVAYLVEERKNELYRRVPAHRINSLVVLHVVKKAKLKISGKTCLKPT